MKKILFILFCAVSANAQNYFTTSIGASYSRNASTLIDFESGRGSLSALGLIVSPRLNVKEFTEAFSLSAGSHLEVSYVTSSINDKTNIYFNLPLVAELNFGLGSTESNDDDYGAYLGGGLSVNKIFNSDVDANFSPIGTVGVRFSETNFEFSYIKGNNFNIFSFGVTTNLDL